jgi:hypothetical protein
MARKRKQAAGGGAQDAASGSSKRGVKRDAAPGERKVADMSVLELLDLMGIAAPGTAQAEQRTDIVARESIHAGTKVVDLTVGDLLLLLTTRRF